MKNLLTTISLTTILLIASSAQANVAEKNYNLHANNHVGYADAHSGNMMMKETSMITNNSSLTNVINKDPSYNAEKDPFSLNYSHDH